MQMIRRAYADQIQFFGREQILMRCVGVSAGEAGGSRLCQFDIPVGDRDQLGARVARKDRGVHRPHKTRADHCDAVLPAHRLSPIVSGSAARRTTASENRRAMTSGRVMAEPTTTNLAPNAMARAASSGVQI